MQLIANNDDIIYLDGTTDPYVNAYRGAYNDQLQETLTDEIEEANYDIGHLFVLEEIMVMLGVLDVFV